MAKASKGREKADPRFVAIRDTREKPGYGWNFDESKECGGTVIRALETGDYSLEGLYERKLFLVERKGSVSELAGNLTGADKKPAFYRELERLEEFAHPFLVLEFTPSQLLAFPQACGLPAKVKASIRIKGPYLLRLVNEIEFDRKVRVVWTGTRGSDYCLGLMKRAHERYFPSRETG